MLRLWCVRCNLDGQFEAHNKAAKVREDSLREELNNREQASTLSRAPQSILVQTVQVIDAICACVHLDVLYMSYI